jgi:hypothetical protein
MLKHLFNEMYEIFMNFILIITYYLDFYHYSFFEYIIKNINLDELSELEKLRLISPKAQNNETTFANYNNLIEYFSNYIINHNKYLFALVPFTEKHYLILRTNSSFLSKQCPVINKIKAYLEENHGCDADNKRYNNIKSVYTEKCAENDLYLHILMCTTHLMKDSINRIFIYKNIDIKHYNECSICRDESIWFVNCGTKEDYYESKLDQIKEYCGKIKHITNLINYESEKDMIDNIIKECNCTESDANFLISADSDQRISLVLDLLDIDKDFFHLYKENKSNKQNESGCPFSKSNTKSGCPFSKKTE